MIIIIINNYNSSNLKLHDKFDLFKIFEAQFIVPV